MFVEGTGSLLAVLGALSDLVLPQYAESWFCSVPWGKMVHTGKLT